MVISEKPDYVRISIGCFLVLLILACSPVVIPTEKYGQYSFQKAYEYSSGELTITLANPLQAPLRVWTFNADTGLQRLLNEVNPVELQAGEDTVIRFTDILSFDNELRFSSRLGSLSKEIEPVTLEYPFSRGKNYRILQGNNTNYTHNTDWSRYAVDFNLSVNDTVFSSTDGYVVGVVDAYEYGGEGEQWKPFANYVTIYEPYSGVFIQYVHLVKDGSLVSPGDEVVSGQPIALSGNTGQSSTPHLHLNCLVPEYSEEGLRSVPFKFVNGVQSTDLKAGDVVSN